jgi:putative tricarboxylic transport membrane protein
MADQKAKVWIVKRDTNVWVGLFLMILSAAVISEALELEVGTPGNPGSGFMIFGAAAVLGALALHQFVKSLRVCKPIPEGVAERSHWGRILAVILANVLYIYLLRPVGYLVCTFLFLFLLFQALEKGRWILRLVGAASTSVVTYLLFARVLQLNLPKGVIPSF